MYQQLTNTLGRRFFRGPQILKKRPPKGSWLPQAKKVARVISNSHIGKLLLWRAPILAKRLPKGPWLPQAKKSPVLSTNHILGSRILKGPNSRKKGLKKAPWSPERGEAQKGPERPREAQRGPERPSVDRTSLQKASKRPLVAPSQKVSSFISNSHIWEAALLKGPNSREKASKRTPGRPRHKSAQF